MERVLLSNWKVKYSLLIIINILAFCFFIISVIDLRNYNIQYRNEILKHDDYFLSYANFLYNDSYFLLAILAYIVFNIIVLYSLTTLINNLEGNFKRIAKRSFYSLLLLVFISLSTLSIYLHDQPQKETNFKTALASSKYYSTFTLVYLTDTLSLISLIIFLIVVGYSLKKYLDTKEYSDSKNTINIYSYESYPDLTDSKRTQRFTVPEEQIIHFSQSTDYSTQPVSRLPNEKIAKCASCGQIISLGDIFCENCGKKI